MLLCASALVQLYSSGSEHGDGAGVGQDGMVAATGVRVWGRASKVMSMSSLVIETESRRRAREPIVLA